METEWEPRVRREGGSVRRWTEEIEDGTRFRAVLNNESEREKRRVKSSVPTLNVSLYVRLVDLDLIYTIRNPWNST